MSKPKPSPLIQFYPDRETPVFTGNTAITVITQKTLRDPILLMFSGGIGGKIKGWLLE